MIYHFEYKYSYISHHMLFIYHLYASILKLLNILYETRIHRIRMVIMLESYTSELLVIIMQLLVNVADYSSKII